MSLCVTLSCELDTGCWCYHWKGWCEHQAFASRREYYRSNKDKCDRLFFRPEISFCLSLSVLFSLFFLMSSRISNERHTPNVSLFFPHFPISSIHTYTRSAYSNKSLANQKHWPHKITQIHLFDDPDAAFCCLPLTHEFVPKIPNPQTK